MKALNGKDSNLTPFQWVVRTKRFKRWFGDWLAVSKRQALEGQKAVKVNTSAFANAQDAEQRRAVGKIEYRKLVDGKVKVVNKIDGRTIKFTSKQFDKLRSHSAKPDIMQIIPSLPDLLANAVPLYSEPEIDQQKYRNISRWTAYGVKADIDGREVYVGLNTFEVKDGSVYIDIFHDHNTIDAKDLRRLTSKPNSVTNPAASTLPPLKF